MLLQAKEKAKFFYRVLFENRLFLCGHTHGQDGSFSSTGILPRQK